MPALLSFHAVLGAFLVILVFILMRQNTADPDLWWHLKNAEYVVSHHSFPLHDAYSFTARGQVWVPHEWFGEMVLYAAYKAGGLRAVFGVSLLLSALIFVGVFYLCYRASGDIKNSMLVTVLAVLLGKVSFGPRTLLLGWLCLVILLILLEPLRRGQPAKLWAIPLLFLFWVNSHGSWFMGMAILGLVIACGLLNHSWAHIDAMPYSRPDLRKLILTAALSFAAVFINPAGLGVILYPLDLKFKQQLAVNTVDEWKSINFHQGNGVLLIGLIVLILALALFSKVRWRLEELALVSLALYMSVTYVRMLFLAGILIPPILASRIKLFSEYDPDLDSPYINAGVLLACGLIIVAGFPTTAQLYAQVEAEYPTKAVAHIESHPVPGNLFNDYVWGGYLIWHTPDVPVFIDGRADIYDHNGTFRDYVSAVNMDDSLVIFDKYKIERALLMPKTPLAYFLSHSPDWQVEYRDDKSVLFRRSAHSPLAAQ